MSRRPLLFLPLLLGACAAPNVPPLAAPDVRPAEIVVGFHPATPDAALAALRERFAAGRTLQVTPHAEWWRVAPGMEAAAIAALGAEPVVKFAHANQRRRLPAPGAAGAPEALRFQLSQAGSGDDPLYSRLWHLERAKFPAAWARTTGQGVIVAVIDSGVDPEHPDLKANLRPLIDEVAAFDRTDIIGDESFAGRDGHGHGTHVCGLVAAVRNNGLGVVGGAPGATILPIKVTANDGETDDAAIAKGITDAVDQGARVLNLSIGGPDPSELLLEALNHAFQRNATVVIAAGNDGGLVNYPAAYPGVIAVGGSTELESVARYSSRGDDLVLVAPGGGAPGAEEGDQVYSTLPTYDCALTLNGGKPKNYGGQAGTSMASPLVSALAALVLAQHPTLSGAQVRTRLAATCDDMGAVGFDEASGWGLINADRATHP